MPCEQAIFLMLCLWMQIHQQCIYICTSCSVVVTYVPGWQMMSQYLHMCIACSQWLTINDQCKECLPFFTYLSPLSFTWCQRVCVKLLVYLWYQWLLIFVNVLIWRKATSMHVAESWCCCFRVQKPTIFITCCSLSLLLQSSFQCPRLSQLPALLTPDIPSDPPFAGWACNSMTDPLPTLLINLHYNKVAHQLALRLFFVPCCTGNKGQTAVWTSHMPLSKYRTR